MTFFALLRHRPMVRMCSPTAASPSASIFCGVSAAANSAARRLVDAGIGRLRRQHHRDQQREGVDVFEFALRLRPLHREAAEDLVAPRPAYSATSGRAGRGRGLALAPSRRRVWSRGFLLGIFHRPSIIERHERHKRSRRRRAVLPGAADAAPLARPHRLHGADGRACRSAGWSPARSSSPAAPGRSSASSASTCCSSMAPSG